MNLKHLILIISISLQTGFLFSQNIDYSQPFTNLIYTNPAFSGTNVCPRFYLNHRTKNYSYDRAFQTYLASYDQAIRTWNIDLGGIVYRDQIYSGNHSVTQISPIISKAIKTSKNGVFKAAFQLDINQISLSNSNTTYPDMIDPQYGFIYQSSEPELSQSKINVGSSVGLLYYSNTIFAGLSVHNVLQSKSDGDSDQAFLSRKYSFHIGGKLGSNKGAFKKRGLTISPGLFFQQVSSYNLLQLGLNAELKPVIIGLYTRISGFNSMESLVPMIGFHQKRFKFAYTCDVYVVGHKKKELGTHEISLTYYFPCGKYSPKLRSINCPGL